MSRHRRELPRWCYAIGAALFVLAGCSLVAAVTVAAMLGEFR